MCYKFWVCLPGSLIHGGPRGGERLGCHREDRTHACERITLPVKKSCWVYPLFSRRKVTSVHCWLNYNGAFTETRWVCPLVPVAAQQTCREVPGTELSLFIFNKEPWLFFFLQCYTGSPPIWGAKQSGLLAVDIHWTENNFCCVKIQNDSTYCLHFKISVILKCSSTVSVSVMATSIITSQKADCCPQLSTDYVVSVLSADHRVMSAHTHSHTYPHRLWCAPLRFIWGKTNTPLKRRWY